MPALPSVANVLNVSTKVGVDANNEAGSEFHLHYTGAPPNSTDLNTLATDIANDWETVWGPLVHTAESLHGVTITDLSSPSGAIGVWQGTKAGTLAGFDQLQASICAVISHQISRRYRGGRPRNYWRVGVSGGSWLNGTNEWSATYVSNISGAWHTFIADVLAHTGLSISLDNIVNVSYYEGFTAFKEPSGRYRNIPTLRPTPLVDTIIGSTVATKLGSQRRRLSTGG